MTNTENKWSTVFIYQIPTCLLTSCTSLSALIKLLKLDFQRWLKLLGKSKCSLNLHLTTKKLAITNKSDRSWTKKCHLLYEASNHPCISHLWYIHHLGTECLKNKAHDLLICSTSYQSAWPITKAVEMFPEFSSSNPLPSGNSLSFYDTTLSWDFLSYSFPCLSDSFKVV